MNKLIPLILSCVLSTSCAVNADKNIPLNVIEQHKKGGAHVLSNEETQFTFIGSLNSVSDKPHMNVHGNEWSIKINVEKILLGSYDQHVIYLGTDNPNDYVFEYGKKYYITMDWGRHGYLLMDYNIVE